MRYVIASNFPMVRGILAQHGYHIGPWLLNYFNTYIIPTHLTKVFGPERYSQADPKVLALTLDSKTSLELPIKSGKVDDTAAFTIVTKGKLSKSSPIHKYVEMDCYLLKGYQVSCFYTEVDAYILIGTDLAMFDKEDIHGVGETRMDWPTLDLSKDRCNATGTIRYSTKGEGWAALQRGDSAYFTVEKVAPTTMNVKVDGKQTAMTREAWDAFLVGTPSMVYPYDNVRNWGVRYVPCTSEHWAAGSSVKVTTKNDPKNEGFSSST